MARRAGRSSRRMTNRPAMHEDGRRLAIAAKRRGRQAESVFRFGPLQDGVERQRADAMPFVHDDVAKVFAQWVDFCTPPSGSRCRQPRITDRHRKQRRCTHRWCVRCRRHSGRPRHGLTRQTNGVTSARGNGFGAGCVGDGPKAYDLVLMPAGSARVTGLSGTAPLRWNQ